MNWSKVHLKGEHGDGSDINVGGDDVSAGGDVQNTFKWTASGGEEVNGAPVQPPVEKECGAGW